MERKITDIYCPECGAPAAFDIAEQKYKCRYCGGSVAIREAQRIKQGFRSMRAAALRQSVRDFDLYSASCSGCGATVVFGENEALSSCAFCGRSLVRQEYLDTEGLPESVIPFALTEDEARARLREWCEKNQKRPEAKKLRGELGELRGFYLPYELVRGPVHMHVKRMDGGGTFRCEGFMNDEFVNRSAQLDNLLLDGMEPYDIGALREFDFAYVAGQRVKISDISDRELEERAKKEAAATYTPSVRKTLQTKAVNVDANVADALRFPVLLPVYYISRGGIMAAVNGQTGKVSVRAEKESHYYFLPWWLKAILATLLFSAVLFGALCLGGMDAGLSLHITGVTAVIFIIVTLCLYSDTTRNSFAVESGREIFTSGEKTFRRERGGLVQNEKLLERRVEKPVYFQTLEGRAQPVVLKFLSPLRVARMAFLAVLVIFFPVFIALIVNGFDFSKINLGGSAVWFCITVPVVPIALLKFGLVELYEHPWIYTIGENGALRRWKEKREKKKFDPELIKMALRAAFIPPGCLAVWFAVISFIVVIYLTAGFE